MQNILTARGLYQESQIISKLRWHSRSALTTGLVC